MEVQNTWFNGLYAMKFTDSTALLSGAIKWVHKTTAETESADGVE